MNPHPTPTSCTYCDEGNIAIRSSVAPDVFVHTDTPVGRRVCPNSQFLNTLQKITKESEKASPHLANPGYKNPNPTPEEMAARVADSLVIEVCMHGEHAGRRQERDCEICTTERITKAIQSAQRQSQQRINSCQVAAKAIDEVVRSVEARCMAADGPVTPTLQEMTEHELRVIWVATESIRQALNPKGEGEKK